MSVVTSKQSYQERGITLEEHDVEILDDEFSFEHGDFDGETDVALVVQYLAGEVEPIYDVPLEQFSQGEPVNNSVFFAGSPGWDSRMFLQFRASGFAKVRVLIARIKRGLAGGFKAFPCKACKLAVKTIMSAVISALGVPTAPTGEFDLTTLATTFGNAINDIANGAYGTALQTLSSLLPANWWNVVLGILQGLNWLFDAVDSFYEQVCIAIGLCPPKAAAGP